MNNSGDTTPQWWGKYRTGFMFWDPELKEYYHGNSQKSSKESTGQKSRC